MPGVVVPRAVLELAAPEVLVTAFAEGATLADGGRPADPAAAARALVAAFRAACLDAGLAPVDPRPSHVVVTPVGDLALLGLGVARPVDRARAARASTAGTRSCAATPDAFAAVAAGQELLDEPDARAALELLRGIGGPLLRTGPQRWDATALGSLLRRARRRRA